MTALYHDKELCSKANQQYNRFILNSTISNNPHFRACCKPGCDQIFWIKSREKAMELKNYQFSGILDNVTYLRGAGYDSKELLEPKYLKLECKKCSTETCFSCGMAYHYPATCDQVQKIFKNKMNLSFLPKFSPFQYFLCTKMGAKIKR